uniref:Uncharacterized protein n=1 Tax=Theropithecus gelada TaxID=9565 RepID=A0A8D2G6T7_THEGE
MGPGVFSLIIVSGSSEAQQGFEPLSRAELLRLCCPGWSKVSLCCPGWSTVAGSRLTASSSSRVHAIPLPQPPE